MKGKAKVIMAITFWVMVAAYGCGGAGESPDPAAGQEPFETNASNVITYASYKAVGAGLSHTCGVTTNGTIYCWGAGLNGELGNGGNSSSNLRVQESTVNSNWASVTGGWAHSCATRTDGSLWCWGDNGEGQLGIGNSVDKNSPTRESTAATDWAAVSAGGYHTCARKTSGAVYCWGMNDHGQIGQNSYDYRYKYPVQVGTATTWKQLSSGMWHSCALKTDGMLWCWGYGWYGQLGYGSIGDKLKPAKVNADTNWALVACGREHTCAKKKDGSLWCWGDNVTYGQLGIGNVRGQKTKPVKVLTAITDWNALSLGQFFSCGKRKSGAIYCWGSNGSGQIGIGKETNPKTQPTKSQGIGTVMITGGSHTCAIKSDNSLWCWGSNASGQLGFGSIDTHSSYPVQAY